MLLGLPNVSRYFNRELSLEFPEQNGVGAPSGSTDQETEEVVQTNNMPVGDVVDQLAQILQLDLSAATNPDAKNQLVVSAVEELVLKLHELSGIPEDDGQGEQPMQGGEGEYPEDGGDQEFEGDDEEQFADEGDGEEFNDEEPIDEEVDDEPVEREQAPPPKRKSVAASFPQRIVNALILSREQQLTQLCKQGKFTPAVLVDLKAQYCTPQNAGLVLSMDDDAGDDGFDRLVAIFNANAPVVVFGEKSGLQTQLSVLDGEGQPLALSADPSVNQNPLHRSAERRAEKAKGK